MASNKDLHLQFLNETGFRVPQSVQLLNEAHKYASDKEYINWLEEKLLEEWKTQKK